MNGQRRLIFHMLTQVARYLNLLFPFLSHFHVIITHPNKLSQINHHMDIPLSQIFAHLLPPFGLYLIPDDHP